MYNIFSFSDVEDVGIYSKLGCGIHSQPSCPEVEKLQYNAILSKIDGSYEEISIAGDVFLVPIFLDTFPVDYGYYIVGKNVEGEMVYISESKII